MKNRQKRLNTTASMLTALLAAVVLWGILHGTSSLHTQVSDGIESGDLASIYPHFSSVEVGFSDVICPGQNEPRNLNASTQTGNTSTKLTDRLIKQLDFDFLKNPNDVLHRNGVLPCEPGPFDRRQCHRGPQREDGYHPHRLRLFASH